MRKDPSFGEVDKNNKIQNFKDLGLNNFVSENDDQKVQDYRKLQLSFINNRIKKRSEIMKKKKTPSPYKG